MTIEPRIRPLVDALNATGLVQTFTSCEGHYGDGRPASSTKREQANVGFFLREGVPERELARLFGTVFAEHQLRGARGAELTIARHHLPPLDGAGAPEAFFDITVRPADPGASRAAKREATDRCLAVVTRAVVGALGVAGRPEDLRADIEGILAAHDVWKRRLADAIVTGGTNVTAEEAAQDDRCAVGAWLHRASEAHVPFRRIAVLHAHFHEEASAALTLARAERKDEARRLVEPGSNYARASADLASALRSLAA